VTFVFPAGVPGIALWIAAVAVWLATLLKSRKGLRVLYVSAVGIMVVNVLLTNFFYYPLLQYQCGSQMGKYIRAQGIPQNKLWAWHMDDPLDAIHFYSRMVVREKDTYPPPGERGDYLLLMKKNLSSLDAAHRPYTIVKEGRLFKVSEITPEFLNPKTRDGATKPYCLVLLK
jgi:hypothetical protein